MPFMQPEQRRPRTTTTPVAGGGAQPIIRTGMDRATAPSTGPVNAQPSAQPGNPMGHQAQTATPEVATGSAPTQTTTPIMRPANAVTSTQRTGAPAAPSGPSTSERAAEIAGSGSPLMRQAATAGRQYAQSRGLINSSIGAGAAQGAVLDRSTELARADTQDELNRFYAGLDKAKFESDDAYRERALAQERTLQERRISLDEELGRGGLALEQERLGFDRSRFDSDESYRRDQMALEERLANHVSSTSTRIASARSLTTVTVSWRRRRSWKPSA